MAVRVTDDDARGVVARLRDAVVADVAHGGNGDATRAALLAIYEACTHWQTCVSNCGAIGGTAGAIEGMVAAMASQLGVMKVQRGGMLAVYALACNHAINKERIGDTPGAFDAMVAGMQAHAGDGNVQYDGMLVLFILARNSFGNQHRMRATPQLLRLVASTADGGGPWDDAEEAGEDIIELAEGILAALGMTQTLARAAAAKVRCHCRYPYMYHSTPYDRSATSSH